MARPRAKPKRRARKPKPPNYGEGTLDVKGSTSVGAIPAATYNAQALERVQKLERDRQAAARNLAVANVDRKAEAAPERDRCRAEAVKIWKATAGRGKPLSVSAVAVRVANRLGLPETRVRSIWRWIANLYPVRK
jgi:hypothetical protein